jgi:hypothetical protein
MDMNEGYIRHAVGLQARGAWPGNSDCLQSFGLLANRIYQNPEVNGANMTFRIQNNSRRLHAGIQQ